MEPDWRDHFGKASPVFSREDFYPIESNIFNNAGAFAPHEPANARPNKFMRTAQVFSHMDFEGHDDFDFSSWHEPPKPDFMNSPSPRNFLGDIPLGGTWNSHATYAYTNTIPRSPYYNNPHSFPHSYSGMGARDPLYTGTNRSGNMHWAAGSREAKVVSDQLGFTIEEIFDDFIVADLVGEVEEAKDDTRVTQVCGKVEYEVVPLGEGEYYIIDFSQPDMRNGGMNHSTKRPYPNPSPSSSTTGGWAHKKRKLHRMGGGPSLFANSLRGNFDWVFEQFPDMSYRTH